METEFETSSNVSKRLVLLRFLFNVLSSKTPYLGTLIIPLTSISALYNSPTIKEPDVIKYRKRSVELFTFGISLGKLLLDSNPTSCCKNLNNLVIEYEDFIKPRGLFTKSPRHSAEVGGKTAYAHLEMKKIVSSAICLT
jgi:hypothetical protein